MNRYAYGHAITVVYCGFVGPYITGIIKDATGVFTAAWVYLACSLTLAGLLILTFKKQIPADGVEP